MRTKVERKQRVLEEKLKLNMPSPKVVLDASDCARLLDGAGKTSVVVVEREGKMVAASSLAASSNFNNSLAVSDETCPLLKPMPTPVHSNLPQSKSTGELPEECNQVSVSNSSKEVKEKFTELVTISPNNKADTVSIREASVDQSKPILKPPKKRRGLGMEFEVEASSRTVFSNNGIIDAAPPVSSAMRPINESNLSKSSQRHSVERILQQSSVHSSQHHHSLAHSQPVLSAEMEVSTSSAQTSVPLSDSSSITVSHQSHPPLSLSPFDQTVNNYHPYPHPSSALQSESGSHPIPLPKNISCKASVHNNALHTSTADSVLLSSTKIASEENSSKNLEKKSGDQEQPINLSTNSSNLSSKSKVVISPITSLAGSTMPVEGVTTPVEDSEPDLSAHSTPSGINTMAKHQSGSSIIFASDASDNVLSGVTKCHLADQSRLPVDDLLSSKPSDYSKTSSEGEVQSSNFHMVADTVHEALSTKNTHHRIPINSDVNASSVNPENHNTSCHASFRSEDKDNVEEYDGQKCHQNKADTCGSEDKVDSYGSEDKTVDSSQTIDNEVLVSKSKKLLKKKPEIAMDEASCAQRLTQYALTIDDVIANFVYIQEPVEEIRLTEEEELALRGQFDDSSDPCNSERLANPTQSSSGNQAIECNSKTPNSTLKMQSAETQTIIYPAKSVPKKRPTEPEKLCQVDGQANNQVSSNIDSILDAVASDMTKDVIQSTAGITVPEKEKKKKKKKVITKESETASEIKAGDEESSKSNNVKDDISKPNEQIGRSTEIVQSTRSESHQVISDCTTTDKLQLKSLKPKKAKKRKSDEKSSTSGQVLTQPGCGSTELSSEGPIKKKKKTMKILKSAKDVEKHQVKDSACLPETSSELTSLLGVNRDLLGANKTTETSDIGESIASTSGGSEQDTPVHESEVISSKQTTREEDKDKDGQDTGLESSGGEDSLNKPLRHYKKRLDFVKCDQCEHQARGRSALSRHMKKVHQMEVDMPHKCPHCNYSCSKQASLNRHLFTHGVFSCSRCSFSGETRVALTQHVLENHRDKLDLKLCKICNRYIKCDQLTIEEHTSTCQGPTPFKCTVCEKEFKYGSSLRVHYHTHFPDQPKKYKCELCDYRTNYKANLHKHQKNMHAVKGKEIQCPDCGKLFSTEDNMRRHRKVHTLARPFACETCKKTFKTSGALKGHQLIHTAIRPYTCNITGCNRSFRTPKFLKSHQEEFHRLVPKKFFCSVEGCNFSFFKRSHLKRHSITHTGERNFHCTWPGCNKSFRHSDNLKVHFRAHSTDKVLQCHLCEFKTKQKSSMFWHKKKVHQIVQSSKSGSVHKSEGSVGAEKQEAHSEKVSAAPQVAESGCQTALALSDDHSDDGSLMESPAHIKAQDNVTQLARADPQVFSKSEANTKVDGTKVEAHGAESRGSKDLYEFKSDDESEDEAPGSFRRDLISKDELPPLPPPPKELLMKNEMEEQKEQARKEREQKKELEKQEKLQKREQEKKERAEKKELEKKEKIEKKEMEKKEKNEKKEQEKKEKTEKKELEKKEKEEKKELEKKERTEKKEMEKKEKIEQKELEKKEKAEKKELEKKEKLEKKELEIKEKTEKREKEKQEKEQIRLEKEKAKKEREEQRKAKEQLKLEKGQEKEKKKAEKDKQLKNTDKQESDSAAPAKVLKKSKPGKKSQKTANEDNNNQKVSNDAPPKTAENTPSKEPGQARNCRKKLPAKPVGKKSKKSQVLVRKQSPRRMSLKNEEGANKTKPKRGRKKKIQDVPEVNKVSVTRKNKLTLETEEHEEISPAKKKKLSKKSADDTVRLSPRSPRSPRGISPATSPRQPKVSCTKRKVGRPKAIVSPVKKRKSLPVTRKMSTRLRAKTEVVEPAAPMKTLKSVKGRRGAKPGPKKKFVQKREPEHEEVKEGEKNSCKPTQEGEDVENKASPKKNIDKSKDHKTNSKKEKRAGRRKVEVKKISTRGRAAAAAAHESEKNNKEEMTVETVPLADHPDSPAYSEEHMLQGNASPYRGLSDADEEEEDKEKSREESEITAPSPTSIDLVVGTVNELATEEHEDLTKEEQEVSTSGNLRNSDQPKKDDEPDASQNEDAYSSDDDVSNDIPLTPPRAPAPPPRESSDDEMEETIEPEPSAPFSVPGPTTPFSVPGPNTPFSVPGPNTPFSVPGPHTPFSVPPPTNLMQQQHSVPSEDTPLSTVPSVQSTEMHSHSSVELQHSLGSVEMQHSQNSVEDSQQQGSVEMHQPHSQGSIEMQHQSRNSTEMRQHNSSGEINRTSGELHTQVSGDLLPHRPTEQNHLQGSAQLHSSAGSVDMHSHRPVEMFSHESVEMRHEGSYDPHSEASHLQKLREEAMNSVKCSEGGELMSATDKFQFPHHIGESFGKYSFPHPLPDHSLAEADKAYFDQYLKNWSSARGGLAPNPASPPSGLQQLEAMVGKSHLDGGGPKSPVSSLPSSVITTIENTLAAEGRPPKGDALPHHHEALYAERETTSSLPRLPDRQSTNTPLPPSGAPTPAFEAFSHLNPLHPAAPSTAVPGRDNAFLRQADNLFPTPTVSSSYMAEAMFQRQAMSTPFLPPPPPQTGERSSVLTSHNSSSTLLGRAGTIPTPDMFSASQAMQQTMPRNPFTNAWASQESRPSHWQTPYLPRQSNMTTPGSFFPGKESYLTGREFMFDPTSVRASAEGRSMFPSLSGSSQSQDSLPLDRFDLSNYFPNAAAMVPYGSSAAATSLDYTRTGHASSTKPFDERYRQASMSTGATSGAIPNFRGLPTVSGSGPDMFHGIPGVNPHFNLYAAGNPMSYHHHHHSQHPHHHQLTDSSVNSAFLSHHHPHHPGAAQHAAMFERDYRGLYPQNAAAATAAAAAAYPFINDRQYPGASSKLGHSHPSVGPSASASSRTSTQEGQMQDPYRTMLYRY